MRDRVPPRWHATVGPHKLAKPGLELDGAASVTHGLPLDGAVEAGGARLQHLPARHAEEKRLVGSRQVLAVAALEADDVVGIVDEFDGPFGGFRRSVAVLDDGFLVFIGC